MAGGWSALVGKLWSAHGRHMVGQLRLCGVAEPQIVNTLRSKRDELERIISSYETATTAARRDLAHVTATLELFERHGAAGAYPSRLSIARMFKRGEIFGSGSV